MAWRGVVELLGTQAQAVPITRKPGSHVMKYLDSAKLRATPCCNGARRLPPTHTPTWPTPHTNPTSTPRSCTKQGLDQVLPLGCDGGSLQASQGRAKLERGWGSAGTQPPSRAAQRSLVRAGMHPRILLAHNPAGPTRRMQRAGRQQGGAGTLHAAAHLAMTNPLPRCTPTPAPSLYVRRNSSAAALCRNCGGCAGSWLAVSGPSAAQRMGGGQEQG